MKSEYCCSARRHFAIAVFRKKQQIIISISIKISTRACCLLRYALFLLNRSYELDKGGGAN